MRFLYLVIVGLSLVSGHRYRLPKDVIPLRYHLTLEPLLSRNPKIANHKFYGKTVIELEVLKSTSTVTVHATNLQINTSSLTLKNSNGQIIAVRRTSRDEKKNSYTLHLQDQLIKDVRYNLTFGEFSGEMGDGYGFYVEHARSLISSTPSIIAGTHFQPKGARMAFPCFDEPHFKARFTVSLVRTEEYFCLSNTELVRTEKLPKDRFMDVFEETPIMSTYIVSFAVLNFVATEKLERHRGYSPKANIYTVEQVLTDVVSLLQWFEGYTGVPYALPKLDHLIVPRNCIVDEAMENWGLIVYQEQNFEYSNQPQTSKEVLEVQAHEISHQWFGNLVTPENFDYLWLSESITTYVKTFAASSVQPTFRLEDQFLIENVHKGFWLEESKGTYSLNYFLPDNEKFPPFHIIYEKGSSIVRMMSHFLSVEVFQQALHKFLVKNQYKSVVPLDLYDACQEASIEASSHNNLGSMTVSEIMETWDSNPGYPIITITRNYQTGLVIATQHSAINLDKSFWNVPITYVHSTNPNFKNTIPKFWLTKESGGILNIPASGWLIVNTQQSGYYRVNYDLENWKRIIKFLHNGNINKIHVLNRAQLINDAFYFAYTQTIPISIPLTLCEYLPRENDYIPFASFRQSMSYYLKIYKGFPSETEKEYFSNHSLGIDLPPSKPENDEREYKIFQRYIRNIMTKIRSSLGDKDGPKDTFIERLFRSEIKRYFRFYFT